MYTDPEVFMGILNSGLFIDKISNDNSCHFRASRVVSCVENQKPNKIRLCGVESHETVL